MSRILVIRLGALGDFFLSFPAFAAIRQHHAHDRITLLTTPPFAAIGAEAPWFDRVAIDTRPAWLNLTALWRLRQELRAHDRVYDLQTSRRSSRYFTLAGRPPWSGIAHGSRFRHANPQRDRLHTVARQREQLAIAGVTETPAPDLSWLADQGPRLAAPYALLVPGTSPAHDGAKRWPLDRFVRLAAILAGRGITPVILGTRSEAADAAAIQAECPAAIDLTGRTTIQDLAGLAARASLAIGGDTGPIHLAAIMGCRTIALFSRFSDPIEAIPYGDTILLREPDLRDLTLAGVVAALPDP